jgi:lipoprotein-releasing system permease protein
MYILLLCRKYLTTRYIALASIVSVMLGVATMIVVNSVMKGFSVEMQARIHGVLSDVIFEANSLDGFLDPEWHMNEIRKAVGEKVAGMTPTVVVPAMLSYKVQRQWVTQPVQLIGIDERTQGKAGDFGQFLNHPANREQLSFDLRRGGYDTSNKRQALADAGWSHRVRQAELRKAMGPESAVDDNPMKLKADDKPAQAPGPAAVDPFAPKAGTAAAQNVFDPAKQQHTGLVLGIALSAYQDREGNERFLALPGDDVRLTFPTAATPPRGIDDLFTIVDFYECKMSEYDSSFVFVPIEKLQQLRGMIDPQTRISRVTSIQIKLKNDGDGDAVRDKLRAVFHPEMYRISTWRDKQGPLLAAVQMETAILNVLLFLIIAVAGFGILAIFFMIVVEKTKDIGVLKSLGASSRGIMGIFLGYGLSLGAVGAGGGLALGMLIVGNINWIADQLGKITGHKVFDPSIYYFYKIPTIVDPFTVSWIVLGALVIAVGASVLPAMRAARLHPVEALRYD